MPEIPLRVTLENSCDRELVDRGHALDVAVRRTPVEAIVDTGIVSLLIPEEVANALGLRRRGTRTVVSADERREQWPVGRGVTIEIGSLVTQTECIIGPAGSQVLIGRVVRAHSRFPGAVCRQRWTVRLGEVEPVFGQTGRVVLDITARTAHDGALKWTRAPSTPRAARSILATFPSTCALPSGGRWSLRRVLQRPGRQRKRSSAKSSCGPSRTSSSAPSSPPCCNARCAPPRLATRRAPSCATCPGGCGATAWRPSTFAPPGARRCRSRRRTTARNTPVGRSGGRDSTP